jgi:sortase (surface protein transpeptidase)
LKLLYCASGEYFQSLHKCRKGDSIGLTSWIAYSFHRTQLHKCEKERNRYKTTQAGMEELVKNSQRTATEFEAQLTDALKVKVCMVN